MCCCIDARRGIVIVENGVKLRLNIVDTPGYGDQVNNENWCVECIMEGRVLKMWDSWDPIVKYIKDQHSAYLRKELTAMRDRYIQDTRIHCCLYFISPTGHSLRAIDVIVMKKLSEVVNVVPVIAKADSLTLEEREAFKQKVWNEGSCLRGEADCGFRFVLSWCTTTFGCIRLTQTTMTKRRFS